MNVATNRDGRLDRNERLFATCDLCAILDNASACFLSDAALGSEMLAQDINVNFAILNQMLSLVG